MFAMVPVPSKKKRHTHDRRTHTGGAVASLRRKCGSYDVLKLRFGGKTQLIKVQSSNKIGQNLQTGL